MGYNATLVVLLDRLDEIERDPEFGKKVADAIKSHRWPDDRKPYITGQTQVIDVQHADTLQVIAVGGNTGRVIGYGLLTHDDDDLLDTMWRPKKERGPDPAADCQANRNDAMPECKRCGRTLGQGCGEKGPYADPDITRALGKQ